MAWEPVELAYDGWGPPPTSIPPHLADVPFAPFGKGDKIGRASDWTQGAYQKYPGDLAPSMSAAVILISLNACRGVRSETETLFSGRYGQQQGPPVFNFFSNEEVCCALVLSSRQRDLRPTFF
jgi:translation initiation factor 3 subunit D